MICTEEGCDWREVGNWKTANKHANSAHGGRRVRTFVPRTPEELRQQEREINRAKKARQRANAKVRTLQNSRWEVHADSGYVHVTRHESFVLNQSNTDDGMLPTGPWHKKDIS
jgi:hypothetical protein